LRRSLLAFVLIVIVLSREAVPDAVAQAPPDEEDSRTITVTRRGQQFRTTVLREAPDPDRGRPARAGSLIVKFKPGAGVSDRAGAHQQAGSVRTEDLLLDDAVRVKVPAARAAQALAAYRASPFVEYAEPDLLRRAAFTPSDSFYGSQWALAQINAEEAWDVSRSLPAVRIAILDGGIFSPSSAWGDDNGFPDGHPDVGPKVVQEVNFSASPDFDDWAAGGHGTRVAGIAAALTNNAEGIAGVGFNASLVNVKICDDAGSCSVAAEVNGILWAAGCDTNPCGPRRADIINLSIGAAGACLASEQNAINQAWAQGLVIIAAAGNGGADGVGDNGSEAPGNCANVISVAASTPADTRAGFSNYGANVDVAAPGVCIIAPDNAGSYDGNVEPLCGDGTSFAAPHVTGLAALIWSTLYNTSNTAVVSRIFDSADETVVSGPLGSVHGRIDAGAALPGADLSVTKTVNDPDVGFGTQVTFTVTVTNNGPDVATGITVDDLLPAGLTYVSDVASEGTYDETTGDWTGLALDADESETLQITATVATPGAKTNTASITASSLFDPDATKNSDSAVVTGHNYCNGLEVTIEGTDGDDELNGTAGPDVIFAGAGNDVINGGGGNDTICGGDGNDIINGQAGDDDIFGEGGKDALNGGPGDDEIDGGAAVDFVTYFVEGGVDTNPPGGVTVDLSTNPGTASGHGNDTITNVENITGSLFADTLTGSASDNVINGVSGNDTLNGGDGHDHLNGGGQADILNGGLGFDRAVYASAPAAVTVDLATQTMSGGGSHGGDTLNSIERVTGSSFDDVLTGGAGQNYFMGGPGVDTIDGGPQGDTVQYGAAPSAVTVDLSTNPPTVTGGDGNDILVRIEHVQGSAFNDTLTGNAGLNVLRGNAGDDTINGGDNDDLLEGGDGADTLDGGPGTDVCTTGEVVSDCEA
jgi:uncharacterized repeat protein (TIGR01451 family)